jgi:hypothetical protein
MRLSPFVRYLELIDSLADVNEQFFENRLQRYRDEFLKREWVKEVRYLTHHMVDYFDDLVEVEIDVNIKQGVYSYKNPQRLGHIVSAPLWEVTLYSANLQKWLEDLSEFIGIAPESRLSNRDLLANQVWCLGEIHVAQAKVPTKVLLARRQNGQSDQLIKEALDDRFDPGDVIVLVDTPSNPSVFGEHPERCFADFVDFSGGHSSFDKKMLDRILTRGAAQRIEHQPEEYLDGKWLMLAHLPEPIELSAERLKLVSSAWGQDGKIPPLVSWVEINEKAKTGYVSFDDAFSSEKARELIFDRASRGKYRLRRAENLKTINQP